MNKQQFETALRAALQGMPQEDIDRFTEYYLEMIDDRMEDGATEQEAVAALGSIEELVSKILAETPLPTLVKNKLKPHHTMRAWEIVLLVLGFPVWGSLLIALISVLFSLYVVLWSLVIAVVAVFAAVAASSLGVLVLGVATIGLGDAALGAFYLGVALILAALSIFLFFAMKGAAKGTLVGTKRLALYVKSCFLRKDVAK